MGDFVGETTVDARASALFDYLADVGNLPRYFARMTSAEPGEGQEVRTTATMPDGQETQGDAWFRVDAEVQALEWGSEGASSYRGRLEVSPAGDDSSTVRVELHTERADGGDPEVQQGVDETLANIKRLVEAG